MKLRLVRSGTWDNTIYQQDDQPRFICYQLWSRLQPLSTRIVGNPGF